MSDQELAPNCYQCAYFQTSWDSRAPRGCRKFGFKCKNLPSLEVLATTGKHCVFWVQKEDAESGGSDYFSPSDGYG